VPNCCFWSLPVLVDNLDAVVGGGGAPDFTHDPGNE
jgi:hypothetical protein